MSAKQTCICCGSLLQGSETSYTFTCYKCVSEQATRVKYCRLKNIYKTYILQPTNIKTMLQNLPTIPAGTNSIMIAFTGTTSCTL